MILSLRPRGLLAGSGKLWKRPTLPSRALAPCLFHRPVVDIFPNYPVTLAPPSQQALLKGDTETNSRVFQSIATVYPHDTPAFDASELPFFFSQGLRAGEIQLDDAAPTRRCGHGNADECPYPADVRTVAIEEPTGIRQPYTDRP